MATIHRTTMVPGKLALLGDWLPRQAWFQDPGRRPTLSRAGGFRLDGPAGDVGIEFIFVTDDGAEGTTYHVPLTYRGAPLSEAEDGLLGTSEHGVLGRRWIYDAAHDPVAVTQLLGFICGATAAQHQNESDTPDPSVGRHWASAGRLVAPNPLQVENIEPGRTTIGVDLIETSSGPSGHALDLVRVLPTSSAEEASLGYVEADWTRLDGSTGRGRVVVVR